MDQNAAFEPLLPGPAAVLFDTSDIDLGQCTEQLAGIYGSHLSGTLAAQGKLAANAVLGTVRPAPLIKTTASTAVALATPESQRLLRDLADKSLLSVYTGISEADVAHSLTLADKGLTTIMLAGVAANVPVQNDDRTLFLLSFGEALAAGKLAVLRDTQGKEIKVVIGNEAMNLYSASYKGASGNTAVMLMLDPAQNAGESIETIMAGAAWQVTRELVEGKPDFADALVKLGLPSAVIRPAAVQLNGIELYKDFALTPRSWSDTLFNSDALNKLKTSLVTVLDLGTATGAAADFGIAPLPDTIISAASAQALRSSAYGELVKSVSPSSDDYIELLKDHYNLRRALYGDPYNVREMKSGFAFSQTEMVGEINTSALIGAAGREYEAGKITAMLNTFQKVSMDSILLTGLFREAGTVDERSIDWLQAMDMFGVSRDPALKELANRYMQNPAIATETALAARCKEAIFKSGAYKKQFDAFASQMGMNEEAAFTQWVALLQLKAMVAGIQREYGKVLIDYPFMQADAATLAFVKFLCKETGIDGMRLGVRAQATDLAAVLEAVASIRAVNPEAEIVVSGIQGALLENSGIYLEEDFSKEKLARMTAPTGNRRGWLRLTSESMRGLKDTDIAGAVEQIAKIGPKRICVVLDNLILPVSGEGSWVNLAKFFVEQIKLDTRPRDAKSYFDEGHALGTRMRVSDMQPSVLALVHRAKELGFDYLGQAGKEAQFMQEAYKTLRSLEQALDTDKLNREAARDIRTYIQKLDAQIKSAAQANDADTQAKTVVQFIGLMQGLSETGHQQELSRNGVEVVKGQRTLVNKVLDAAYAGTRDLDGKLAACSSRPASTSRQKRCSSSLPLNCRLKPMLQTASSWLKPLTFTTQQQPMIMTLIRLLN